ncbi:MAG: DUF4287 domain-containing protein [Saprospiraceae bacterium]|nr:DUF4287 domain-containing protein [Saprospiraceae bacterium]
MSKSPAEFEKEFLDSLSSKTGKKLEDWIQIMKKSGFEKTNDLIEYLKTNHSMNHMQAQLLTGIYLNGGKPVYMDEDQLLENQFAKCPEMKGLFHQLSDWIITHYPDTKLIPKKTYLSFTASREFAAVNVKSGEIRLGLDLGDLPFEGQIQKSKLTGPMPRISHMLVLKNSDFIDKELSNPVRLSYQRTHKL